ncbi:hypothetical protein HMPREF9694_05607 [Klebsiella michiganensis]|nr:hypothetical protein HMPREF9694_05607 [Klebsiella michiganensis]
MFAQLKLIVFKPVGIDNPFPGGNGGHFGPKHPSVRLTEDLQGFFRISGYAGNTGAHIGQQGHSFLAGGHNEALQILLGEEQPIPQGTYLRGQLV